MLRMTNTGLSLLYRIRSFHRYENLPCLFHAVMGDIVQTPDKRADIRAPAFAP